MSTTTVAAVVPETGAPFSLEEVELDELRADEALVRMVATGLCHSDLSARAGLIPFPLPGVLGHEGAGVVEAVGADVGRVKPGDRVLASFTSCGGCRNCRDGHPAYCADFLMLNVLGGMRKDFTPTMSRAGQPVSAHFFGQSSFARRAIVDERSLVKVEDDAPLEVLAPLGCGIQTGTGAVLNVLRPSPGSTVAVIGAGAVGMAAIMAARLSGATEIVAVDLVASRLELATELGATAVVDANAEEVVDGIFRATGGSGVDYAVECSGSTAALESLIQALGPMGTCAVVGVPPVFSKVPFDVNFLLNGRRIVGVTEGDSEPGRFIPALVRLWRQGRLPIDRLLRSYPFEQIEQAAADAASGAVIKPVLRFE